MVDAESSSRSLADDESGDHRESGRVEATSTGTIAIVIPARFKVPENFVVLLAAKNERARKEDLPDAIQESVARHKATNTRTDLTPFGHRLFDSFAAFELAWELYKRENWVRYRVRTSQTVADFNKKTPWFQLGVELSFVMKTYRCIHGLYQESRGSGQRTPRTTSFSDCEARLTVYLVCVDGRWAVHSVSEVIRHNRKISELVYNSYRSAAILLEEHDLYDEVAAMIQAKALTMNTLDVIGLLTGEPLRSQQLANFKRDRMGGKAALANVKLLLARFTAFIGYRCLLIVDQEKQVCGFVMQSAAQRHMFDQYGDSLILDWTHNTNNAGYYLGALMVTSVSGSGVSVLDFLCLSQSKEMMKQVFKFFIKMNPGATSKPRSVVIDKDYTEWAILREMFPGVTVLLCQFHAVKWFSQVVCDDKYDIPPALQDRVFAILRDMVYVRTTDDFDSRKWLLERLLGDVSPAFLVYMTERWYSCRAMWSDCQRGAVFTAMNPTSNRIESGWGQVKEILGLKLRMDMCFEAVFTYATAVLRREIHLLVEYDGPTSVLRSEADPFLRPVLVEISDYCASYVTEQYDAHFRMLQTHTAVQVNTSEDWLSVEKYETNGEARLVNIRAWSCTCASYVTSALPCRHIIFVSRIYLRHERLPLAVIPARWMLAYAAKHIEPMRKWAGEIQSLRTSILTPGASAVKSVVAKAAAKAAAQDVPQAAQDDFDFSSFGRDTTHSTVAHVILRRREVASGVVVDNIEERNVANSAFEPLRAFLMAQSTRRFRAMAAHMQDVSATLLNSWEGCELEEDESDTGDNRTTTCGDEAARYEMAARITGMVSDAFTPVNTERHVPRVVPTPRRDVSFMQVLSLQPPEPPGSAAPAARPDLIDTLLSSPDASPVEHFVGDDRSVSSLGISDASAIIQAAAIRHAAASWRASVADAREGSSTGVVSLTRSTPGSDRAAKRSAAAADLDEGILAHITLASKPSSKMTRKQKSQSAGAARIATVEQRSNPFVPQLCLGVCMGMSDTKG